MPLVLVAGFAAWYAHRVRTLRRAGGSWPPTRILWCAAGLTSWLLVTVGVIGAYAPVLFSVRAVQVITLLMITPQLLAHAMPFTLARDSAQQVAHRVEDTVVVNAIVDGDVPGGRLDA